MLNCSSDATRSKFDSIRIDLQGEEFQQKMRAKMECEQNSMPAIDISRLVFTALGIYKRYEKYQCLSCSAFLIQF